MSMIDKAHAPYSKYHVGASVLMDDETIIGGCNIESSSYGLTCCAERIAIYNAISGGLTSFKALAVVTKNGGFPCGACRQVIWEQCGNIPVFITNKNGKIIEKSSASLLPEAFDKKKLSP
jgi:cytidine deaminase